MDQQLMAAMVPKGEVTESVWWEALADRVTDLVKEEPDPEAAMKVVARAMGTVEPDNPEQSGQVLVQRNLELRTALTLAVMAIDDPFPVKVVRGSHQALEAMREPT